MRSFERQEQHRRRAAPVDLDQTLRLGAVSARCAPSRSPSRMRRSDSTSRRSAMRDRVGGELLARRPHGEPRLRRLRLGVRRAPRVRVACRAPRRPRRSGPRRRTREPRTRERLAPAREPAAASSSDAMRLVRRHCRRRAMPRCVDRRPTRPRPAAREQRAESPRSPPGRRRNGQAGDGTRCRRHR